MLNYSKYIFAIFIGLLILSCTNSDSALEEHQIVSEVFDKNEISNLQEILDFFTQEICTSEGGNSSNPRECFDKLQSRLNRDSPSSGVIVLEINYSEQKKLYDLPIFNEIWYFDNYGLELSNTGKYAEYLESLGKEYESVSKYSTDLSRSGALSGSMTAALLLTPEKFNTADVGVRLLIAIHYLTHNDQYHRNVEN